MSQSLRPKSELGRSRKARRQRLKSLRRASWAFSTRRVSVPATSLLEGAARPTAGDLVLARVDAIGHHGALQLVDGRRRTLFPGDSIVVAYGNRYAPNQFEAVVPESLEPCHLVAGGGVAGLALSWHTRISKGPTEITPIGLLAIDGERRVNLRDHALPFVDEFPAKHPPVIAVVGTAMDSGKTQSCAFLVKGLRNAGLRVGYAKVTGTGSGGDTWLLHDAGARPVLDFTDLGLPSTYLVAHDEVERVFVSLIAHLTQARVHAIVLEIADGVLQCETAALLESRAVKKLVGGFVFAGCDAMGAVAGADWLRTRELPLLAVSGVLTAAQLQRQEAMLATGLRALSRQDLAYERTALELIERARPAHGLPARVRARLRRIDGAGTRHAAANKVSGPANGFSPGPQAGV